MEEMERRMETGRNEIQEKVDRVLRPEQRTKLNDVTFQLSGGLEAPRTGIQTLATLDLTDAQKEQVRKFMQERTEAMARLRENMGEIDWRNPEEQARARSAMEGPSTRFAEQVKGILTPEQRAKAEKLTAEAPALRERLRVPAPGQPRGPQQGQGRQQPPGGGFVPGQGAWRPGQDTPNPPPRPDGQPQPRRGFPR